MYVLYYASMLQCWHLVWILVRTDQPCLGVGCHTCPERVCILANAASSAGIAKEQVWIARP
jgi:hypothetical protein